LTEALPVLQALPVNALPAIGLNCCDYRHLSSLAKILVTFIVKEHQPAQGQGRSRALVLYPNSGEEWDAVAKVFRPKPPQATTSTTTKETSSTAATIETSFVDCLMEVIESVEATWREKMNCSVTSTTTASAAASFKLPPYPRIIVGGCCRTTPAEIATLRMAIDQHLLKSDEK
jgi:S-methylmethionine-dependent homocysteine/selenocysteine methylase